MLDHLEQHFTAIGRWIEAARKAPGVESGLSSEERKQLLDINRTMEHLTKLGIPVPDDLRTPKLRLVAKDKPSIPADELAKRIAIVEDVLERLKVLMQAAKKLRDRLRSDDPPTGTKRYYGVTLLELLEAGLLAPNDAIELQWSKDTPKYEGKICEDGSVMAKTETGWRQFDSLSTAAQEIAGRNMNGWEHWRLVGKNSSRTPLKEIRTRYMEKGGGARA